MSLESLLTRIQNHPETIEFPEVIQVIEENYNYQPCEFSNGPSVINQAGSNEGSCKIFAFAQLHQLSEPQTLACFGDYYRRDVLENPEAEDHANIRSFIKHGWQGISFKGEVLTAKE